MEINISDVALETVKKLLENDKSKKGIYVYLAGVGCGAGGTASFSLAPVEQEEGENVIEIDGIPFIYDNLMLKHTDNISIDYKPSAYDKEIWLQLFMVKSNQ
jgi:Fe-S cluster assembly iron-binding protein IscA